MAGLGQRRSGWRGLGLFWGMIVCAAAIAAVVLQVLGPLPAPAPPAPAPLPQPGPATPATPPARSPEGRIAAPDPGLLEISKAFPPAMLPRVGSDGRMARVVYARPFDRADKRPRIGLMVTGLGMSDADSRAAIDALPGPITLAFSPYASNPDPLLELARARGHELLVSIPMEPQGYPLNDAGSRSLLTGADPAQNRTNLEWALGRIQGYVGATGAFEGMRGERFGDQSGSLAQVLDELGRRGLLYVDPRPGAGKPSTGNAPSRAVDI
ncbi:MAG: divergent polysaccharide deacetylase family protein, partial [Acetobacteraceae bacterium]|nr:divergent polysaccharide deacetylase family protein [Acetobacteraceae bacterium]